MYALFFSCYVWSNKSIAPHSQLRKDKEQHTDLSASGLREGTRKWSTADLTPFSILKNGINDESDRGLCANKTSKTIETDVQGVPNSIVDSMNEVLYIIKKMYKKKSNVLC